MGKLMMAGRLIFVGLILLVAIWFAGAVTDLVNGFFLALFGPDVTFLIGLLVLGLGLMILAAVVIWVVRKFA